MKCCVRNCKRTIKAKSRCSRHYRMNLKLRKNKNYVKARVKTRVKKRVKARVKTRVKARVKQNTYKTALKTELNNALDKINDLRDIQTCDICCDKFKTVAFQCGHRLCSSCAPKMKKCPFCNAVVVLRIPLF